MDEASLFAAALDQPDPAERQAFLDAACAGDAPLRQRLDRLLAADRHAPGILDRTEGVGGYYPEPPLAAQSTFAGRFTLRRKLGEGGMGEVWAADQHEPVRRQVALKVIRPGFASVTLLARFEAERQALALMDHPNIATVFDAGVEGGRPFFVMELIEGPPLTRYCDETRLTLRQRLDLFVLVCQAVQHAHTKGIIHRDLKPSNILVPRYDGTPVVKVIDFGISKATGGPPTGQTANTEVGTLLGTLEYMSPEQAEPNNPDIDTRSDVYSLGVLLYELLTGTTPFPRDQLHAVPLVESLRIIQEADPPRPGARAAVPPELDWVVLKCLEKDRGRRYDTAASLARDVGRFLADEPVQACPPSPRYRAWKFARRYRKTLATAAAFVGLLLAATVSSVLLASWALRERHRAAEQRQAAEDNFRRAMDAVDQMLTRVGEGRLTNVPHMEPVRRDLLKDALGFYQAFLTERGDSPEVRREAANAYGRVGQIQYLLGQRDEAEAAYRQAVALLDQLLEESPGDPPLLNQLGGVCNALGIIYHATDRWPEAEASFRRGVALLGQPTAAPNRLTLGQLHNSQVMFYRQTGDLEKAVAAFHRCKAITEGLLADDAVTGRVLTVQAACHQNVGLAYAAQGKTREAEAAHRAAIDAHLRLTRSDPDDVWHRKRLASAINNLGLLYTQQRELDKAEGCYHQSLDLHKALCADHPKVVEFQVDLAGSHGNMAQHLRRKGRADDSLAWTARAVAILEPLLTQDPRYLPARVSLFDAHMGRAYALGRLDRDAEAAADWRRVLELSDGQADVRLRVYRLYALVHLGDHAGAADEVEALVAAGHGTGRNLFLFAGVLALSTEVVRDATTPPLAVRERLGERYAARAVELLRRARAAGLFRDPGQRAQLARSNDLKRLATRPEFVQLLAEVGKE